MGAGLRVDLLFAALHEECYREMDDPEKQQRIYELMEKSYPDTAEKVRLSRAIREGDIAQVETFADGFQQTSYLDNLLDQHFSL